MTDARYEDKSASALRLRLFEGFVDRSGFNVFARGRALREGVEVEAAVIGSSHWIEVRARSLALTEILACQPPPAGRTVAVWRPGEGAVERAASAQARYRFEARIARLAEARGELARLRELISLATMASDEVGLACEFPAPDGSSRGAETMVWSVATEQGVSVRTAHSYASEGLVVLTHTGIRLANACRKRRESALAACT